MKYPFLDLAASNAPYMEQLCQAAERVVRSGRYVGGQEVEALEAELAEYLRVPHVVAVSNGLDALRLILRAYVEMGVFSPGDEVIVPANTYVATVLAVSDAGLVPVLVDADIDTMNIDTSLIERAVTPRTRAVMPVHLYGNVAWDKEMEEVAARHGLKIIEDCAQAIGARALRTGLFGSDRAGALGHAAGLSFYPTKNLGALGDAGAVATHEPELARAVRALANYGSDRRYHNVYRGFNCRMDPMQAAMLRVKLPHTDGENADRLARALAYERTITRPGLVKPRISPQLVDQVWHQYVVRVTDGDRDAFRRLLGEAGVGTDVHYATPPHRQPCYAGVPHGPLPVTELLAAQMVSLPIGPGTTVKDAAEIAEIINAL